MLLALSLLIGGCQTTKTDSCAGFQPIRPGEQDVATMTINLTRQILAHNRYGQEKCGWKP